MTREEAIKCYIIPAIKNRWNEKKCKEIIKALEQEPKTAYWKHSDRGYPKDWHCSNCGAIVEDDEQHYHNWNYCYHCGAKMTESEGDNTAEINLSSIIEEGREVSRALCEFADKLECIERRYKA